MTFLAPGLLALAAAVLAIPVLVHLWSRRPARVVAVGSTKLLAGARPSQARQLTLSDLPLLALRLLILALAGLAAAGLAWRGSRSTPERIALLAPETATLADSLRTLGWTPRLLQPGLPRIETNAPIAAAGAAPLWSMLRDAARRFPGADSVLVVAPVTAATLDGERPVVPFGVRLQRRGVRAAAIDTLAMCVDGPVEPRDLARLRAALEAIGAASGRPASLATAACATGAAPVIRLAAGASPGALTRNAALGAWELDPAVLQRAEVIDLLTELLAVRARERNLAPMPDAAALPTVIRNGAAAPAASWAMPLAVLALVLFCMERLWAARRLPGMRTSAAGGT